MDEADEGSPREIGDFDALTAGDVPAFAQAYIDRSVELSPSIDVPSMLVSMLLTRLSRLTSYDVEASVHRPAGLNFSSFYVVALLAVVGPLESSRLATLTGMSRSAISALTKTLVRDGWLVKAMSGSDRRSVVLHLSDDGSTRIPAVFADVNRRERAWTASLTTEESGELTRLLTKMLTHAPDDFRDRV